MKQTKQVIDVVDLPSPGPNGFPSAVADDSQARSNVREITRILDRVQELGHRPEEIFSDFVDMAVASLELITPAFVAGVTGEPFQPTSEQADLFKRMSARYSPKYGGDESRYFRMFDEAMSILIRSVADGYHDTLGDMYMEWGGGGRVAGQFFTPMNVSVMMAQMTLQGVEDTIHDRLKEAIAKSPLASSMLLASALVPPELALPWLQARIIPHAIEHYEPVTVHDPCCGSGVMFLAGASCIPAWMVQMGLVQFYGQDISRICVQMAKANVYLYGLNGVYAPQLVHEAEQQIAAWQGDGPLSNSGDLPRNGSEHDTQVAVAQVYEQVTQLSLFPTQTASRGEV